jgi:hypothetical protein
MFKTFLFEVVNVSKHFGMIWLLMDGIIWRAG